MLTAGPGTYTGQQAWWWKRIVAGRERCLRDGCRADAVTCGFCQRHLDQLRD